MTLEPESQKNNMSYRSERVHRSTGRKQTEIVKSITLYEQMQETYSYSLMAPVVTAKMPHF